MHPPSASKQAGAPEKLHSAGIKSSACEVQDARGRLEDLRAGFQVEGQGFGGLGGRGHRVEGLRPIAARILSTGL